MNAQPLDVESLAWLAVHQTWKGRARSLAMYMSILGSLANGQRAGYSVSLKQLGVECGLGITVRSVKDALADLEDLGLVKVTPGQQRSYVGGEWIAGKPTYIELVQKQSTSGGKVKISDLPLVTLDIFTGDQLGHSGYLIFFSVLADGNRGPYSLKDIERLTGLSYSTVQRIMPKVLDLTYTYKEGGRYVFENLDDVQIRDVYGDGIFRDRKKLLEVTAEAEKLDEHQANEIDQVTAEPSDLAAKEESESDMLKNYDNDTPGPRERPQTYAQPGRGATELVETPIAPQAVSKHVNSTLPAAEILDLPEDPRLSKPASEAEVLAEYGWYRTRADIAFEVRLKRDGQFFKMSKDERQRASDEDFARLSFPDAKYSERWPTKILA